MVGEGYIAGYCVVALLVAMLQLYEFLRSGRSRADRDLGIEINLAVIMGLFWIILFPHLILSLCMSWLQARSFDRYSRD